MPTITSHSAPILHTALNIPTAIAHPAIHSLQWSCDGQLLFLTKTAIYILVGSSFVTGITEQYVKTYPDSRLRCQLRLVFCNQSASNREQRIS